MVRYSVALGEELAAFYEEAAAAANRPVEEILAAALKKMAEAFDPSLQEKNL